MSEIIGDKVYVGQIDIGNRAYIGNRAVIGHNTTIEEGAEIKDLTAINPNFTVPAYQIWDGSPGKHVGMVDQAKMTPLSEAGPLHRAAHNVTYAVSYIVMLMLGLLPIFPAFYILYNLDNWIDGSETVDYTPFPGPCCPCSPGRQPLC